MCSIRSRPLRTVMRFLTSGLFEGLPEDVTTMSPMMKSQATSFRAMKSWTTSGRAMKRAMSELSLDRRTLDVSISIRYREIQRPLTSQINIPSRTTCFVQYGYKHTGGLHTDGRGYVQMKTLFCDI